MPQPVAKGSIARAARVLDVLALSPQGASLATVVKKTAFTKTTTFRVLASLQEVNYVVQDSESSKYRLGHKFLELAQSATHTDIAALAEPGLKRLAEITQDTIFLSIPEGATSICIARSLGKFPIQTLTLDKGDRRPLGVGGGALALYCALSPRQRATVCRINRDWLAEYGFTEEMLEAEQALFQIYGYALNEGRIVPGMCALAMPVITRNGHIAAAIAIGAIEDRLSAKRIQAVLFPALQEEVRLLSERLSEIEIKHSE